MLELALFGSGYTYSFIRRERERESNAIEWEEAEEAFEFARHVDYFTPNGENARKKEKEWKRAFFSAIMRE